MYIVISISFFYRMAGLRISPKRNHRNRLSGEFGCRCDPCKIKYKICKTRIHGYRSLGFLSPIATNYLSIKNITKPFIEKNFRIFFISGLLPAPIGTVARKCKTGLLIFIAAQSEYNFFRHVIRIGRSIGCYPNPHPFRGYSPEIFHAQIIIPSLFLMFIA